MIHPPDVQTSITDSPANRRAANDLATIGDMEHIEIENLNPPNYMTFELIHKVPIGLWAGGKYRFSFDIPEDYPFSAPKVKLKNKIYHPNFDYDGNICLNVLREDWVPTTELSQVFNGLMFLFQEPATAYPLNHTAGSELHLDRAKFAQTVKNTLRGIAVDGQRFEKML
eukprot:GHVU01201894.1.p1 GENE.GHVU01201894.1~~GHVU01201894.1.p1  ORF type:complete len:169 (-),score=23.77 GHVU01201894.1:553-1059(-)